MPGVSVSVVCVGLATLDVIVELANWPEPDGRQVVPRLAEAGGGPAATAAVAAARLGCPVAFVGAVGDDHAGRGVRDELAAAGVDVSALSTATGATARSVVLADRQATTRSILHAPGARLAVLPAAARAMCEQAAWIHVDHAGWPLAADCPRSRLSVDAGNPIDGLHLDGVGVYGPSRAALASRYPGLAPGAAIESALAEGARTVVVTLGRDGAVAANRDGAWRTPAIATDVVSTVGAGDVFHGAFVAALADRLPLPRALAFANVAAALSCRGLDGRSAIPTRAELEAALAGAPAGEAVDLRSLA